MTEYEKGQARARLLAADYYKQKAMFDWLIDNAPEKRMAYVEELHFLLGVQSVLRVLGVPHLVSPAEREEFAKAIEGR